MGAIMCMGVATANSILLVSFARERLLASARAQLDFLARERTAQRIQADRSPGRGDLAMGNA